MKNRSIPAVFWERGKAIVSSGDVDIEQIDYDEKVVRANVIGTHQYTVVVNQNDNQADYCSCPFFEGNGYCKHITAVIEFLNRYGNPIDYLFDNVKYKSQTKLKEVENDFNNQWQPAQINTNGMYFLSDLNLPVKPAFKLPDAIDEQVPLEIEVTVALGGVNVDNYYEQIKRVFVKLRIANANDHKFYAIKNIDQFLNVFMNESIYQTGGNAKFSLVHESFSVNDLKMLTYLSENTKVEVTGRSQFDKNQYYLVPEHMLEGLIENFNQTSNSIFLNARDQKFDRVVLNKFDPQSSLIKADVIKVEDGYDLMIFESFESLLQIDFILLIGNQMYKLTKNQARLIDEIITQYERNAHITDLDEFLHFPIGSESALLNFINYFKQIGQVKLPKELSVNSMTPLFQLKKDENQIELLLEFAYEDTDGSHDGAKENLTRQYLRRLGFIDETDENVFQKKLDTGDQIYDFVSRQLPNLKENGQVTTDVSLDAMLADMAAARPVINVTELDGLLSVQFALDGVDETDVDAMLTQLENNPQNYIERNDGSIMLVDDSLRKVTKALLKLRSEHGDFQNGQLSVAANQALSLQASLGDNAVFDEKFNQLAQDLTHPEQFDYDVHATVEADLRPYQQDGIHWIEMLNSYHFGGILADEMGLGKTVQMIAFLINNLRTEEVNLIVAPASLTYNWQSEFEKFAPHINVNVVDGLKGQRKELIADQNAQVLITSYNSARSDISEYQKIGINYLILDEAQYIKNSGTKTNQSLRKLTPRNSFALSGTPIENRIEELWSIFEVIMPGLLPSKKAFKKMSPAEISTSVTPFIMRREKSKVLTELPDKVESNLYNELTTEQKAVYLAQLKQMQVKVKGMSGDAFVKNKIEILAGLTRLRQICDTPALYLDEYRAESGKLNQLKDILEQAKDNDRHVLIFSQFTGMLDKIHAELDDLGLDSFILKGETRPKDRLAMVNRFNEGEKNIFLISLKAGGTGLNLTTADMVILVDLWWNPAVEDQATARAHRIGQKNNVDVFRLITKGTIEEQIFKLQEKKRNFVDQVLSGTENKGSLTEAEIKTILGI